MRRTGVVVIALTVAGGCSEPAPDACPVPEGNAECMPHGFATLDPVGTWQMVGTATETIEDGMPMTIPIDRTVTITRTGCDATFTFVRSSDTRVDDTMLEWNCTAATCPRLTSTTYVCVRASDGALIYASRESRTSTMPGDAYSFSTVAAVLTPTP